MEGRAAPGRNSLLLLFRTIVLILIQIWMHFIHKWAFFLIGRFSSGRIWLDENFLPIRSIFLEGRTFQIPRNSWGAGPKNADWLNTLAAFIIRQASRCLCFLHLEKWSKSWWTMKSHWTLATGETRTMQATGDFLKSRIKVAGNVGPTAAMMPFESSQGRDDISSYSVAMTSDTRRFSQEIGGPGH